MRRMPFALALSLSLSPFAALAGAQSFPWPSPARDARHTSRADASLAVSLPDVAWSLRTGDFAVRRAPQNAPTEFLLPALTGLFALTRDGDGKWAAPLSDPTDAVTAPDGTIYVCEVMNSGLGGSALVALTPEGDVKWKVPIPGLASAPAPGPDGTVYVVNWRVDSPQPGSEAFLFAVDPGGEVKWRYAPDSVANFCPKLLSNGDVIFKQGDSELVDVSPEGERQWTYTRPGGLGCPEVGEEDLILLPSVSPAGMFILDRGGGDIWSADTPSAIADAAYAGNGKVVGAGQDGKLYVFDPAGGDPSTVETGPDPLLEVARGVNVPCPIIGPCPSQDVTLALSSKGTVFGVGIGGGLLWKAEFFGGQYDPFSMQWPERRMKVGQSGTIAVNAARQSPYLIRALNRAGEPTWDWDPGASVTGLAVDAKERVYASADSLYALDGAGAVRWRFRDAARGYSPPILLADGDLVTRGGDTLYALDPENGAVRWKTPLPTVGFIPTTPLPESPLANALPSGGFTGSSGDKVVVVNNDGTVRWSYAPERDSPVLTWVSSPALGKDGTLIVAVNFVDLTMRPCPADGPGNCNAPPPQIVALDPNGTKVWSFTDAATPPLFGEPSVGEDGRVYFVGGESLYALSPDGKKLWSQPGFSVSAVRSVTGRDTPLYVSTQYDQPPALTQDGRVLAPGADGSLRAVSAADGASAWAEKADRIGRIAADADGKALVTGDLLSVLDAQGRLLWSDPLPLPGANAGALAVGGAGRAYTGSGTLVVAYDAVGRMEEMAARADLDHDGAVSVRDAVLVLRMIVGLDPEEGGARPAQGLPEGDVDGDGTVSIRDAIVTLQLVVGVEPGPKKG